MVGTPPQAYHRFFRTRQNELPPNQPNRIVKAAAKTSRLVPLCFTHSRQNASPPTAANAKKTNPVTSSHNWLRIRPQPATVTRPAFMTAPKVRVRRTCRPATRAAIPNFRALDKGDIVIDFIKLPM